MTRKFIVVKYHACQWVGGHLQETEITESSRGDKTTYVTSLRLAPTDECRSESFDSTCVYLFGKLSRHISVDVCGCFLEVIPRDIVVMFDIHGASTS